MYENQVIQKQIAFDIDTKVAEKIFGSSYRSIYFYIEDTMKKNGYKHLQGSVYQSISPVGLICTLFTGQPVRRVFLCVIVMSLN